MCYGTSGERGKGGGGYSFQNRYFFRPLVYKGVEISRVEVYERVGKSLSSFKEPLIVKYIKQGHLLAVSFHFLGKT